MVRPTRVIVYKRLYKHYSDKEILIIALLPIDYNACQKTTQTTLIDLHNIFNIGHDMFICSI